MLLTIPGIGPILTLTIMLEVGTINRFETVGDYPSYSRCVKSERLTNGKKKGENNKKNGNKNFPVGMISNWIELQYRLAWPVPRMGTGWAAWRYGGISEEDRHACGG